MSELARILAVVFLAVFAAGTAAHAVDSTDMSLKMSMASMAGEDMADCQDCPGDDGEVYACDQLCVVTFAAICAPAGTELPDVVEVVALRAEGPLGGHGGPPDPHPPRTAL